MSWICSCLPMQASPCPGSRDGLRSAPRQYRLAQWEAIVGASRPHGQTSLSTGLTSWAYLEGGGPLEGFGASGGFSSGFLGGDSPFLGLGAFGEGRDLAALVPLSGP